MAYLSMTHKMSHLRVYYPYSDLIITIMDKKEVRLISRTHALEYATEKSAGVDLRADNDEPIVIKPFATALIPTGIKIALPDGYELQIRSRSGLALKHRIVVLNQPGTVDADYRGEIGVILLNLGDEDFVVNKGERIAQAVMAPYTRMMSVYVSELDSTERGAGGFGHTGVK